MFLKLFVKSRLFVLLSLLSNFFGLRVRGYGFAPNHNQQGYVAPTFYMCFCYTIFESPHFGQKYAKQYQTNIQCFPTTCSLSMFLFPFRLFALQQISFYQKRWCFFLYWGKEFLSPDPNSSMEQGNSVTEHLQVDGPVFFAGCDPSKVCCRYFQRFFIIKVIVVQFVNQVCVWNGWNIIPNPLHRAPACESYLDCM